MFQFTGNFRDQLLFTAHDGSIISTVIIKDGLDDIRHDITQITGIDEHGPITRYMGKHHHQQVQIFPLDLLIQNTLVIIDSGLDVFDLGLVGLTTPDLEATKLIQFQVTLQYIQWFGRTDGNGRI